MKTEPEKNNLYSHWAEKIRFILVGVANTAVDFAVLNILLNFATIQIYAANLVSTSVAMCLSLYLNKTFVFHKNGKISPVEIFSFIGVTITGIWGVQSLVIFLLTSKFPMPLLTVAHTIQDYGLANSTTLSFLVDNGAKIVATIASLIWNYLLYKYVVFRKSKKQEA